MSFCKGLVDFVVEKVCNHAYLRVLEEIKQLEFNVKDVSIEQCSSCHLPFQGSACQECNSTWCGREYYCKKPTSGVFDKCLNACTDCLSTCHICNVQLCYFSFSCCNSGLSRGAQCAACNKYTCVNDSESENTVFLCKPCYYKNSKKIKLYFRASCLHKFICSLSHLLHIYNPHSKQIHPILA